MGINTTYSEIAMPSQRAHFKLSPIDCCLSLRIDNILRFDRQLSHLSCHINFDFIHEGFIL